jgi:hypothetical protein
MRNLWIQMDSPFVTWTADLEPLRSTPARAVELVARVLAAGAEHQVFDVVEARAIAYQADRDGPLAPRLREAFDRDGIVDLFGFTDAALAPRATASSSAARAWLAWYDRADVLTEGWVDDPGAVLRSLEPVPGSIAPGFTRGFPPVRITGWRFPTEAGAVVTRGARRFRFEVELHSDLWFPWVYGSAHPEADHLRMFDNRALATRHTPRLNRFLEAVAAEVRAAGGSWEVDLDATGTSAIDWVVDAGLDLDRPPAHVMPARALDAEWY